MSCFLSQTLSICSKHQSILDENLRKSNQSKKPTTVGLTYNV
jgi:hypothetical protein